MDSRYELPLGWKLTRDSSSDSPVLIPLVDVKEEADAAAESYGEYGRSIRIPLGKDLIIFTPIPRCSYAWAKGYNRRSAVERVNGRLDEGYRFEKHYIRGHRKMELRFGLAFLCILVAAASW